MPEFSILLDEEFRRLGLEMSRDAKSRLARYGDELEHWNKKLNLTSLSKKDIARRLIAEPCWIGRELQMSGTLADIGSGNGSPGIPLAISCGLEKAHLIEARSRRAAFLRHATNAVGVEGVVHKVRVENMTETLLGVDWVSLQAVHPTAGLLETLQRVFAATTRVVWITSGKAAEGFGSIHLSVPDSTTIASVLELDQI